MLDIIRKIKFSKFPNLASAIISYQELSTKNNIDLYSGSGKFPTREIESEFKSILNQEFTDAKRNNS